MLYRRRSLETPRGSLETPAIFPACSVGKRSADGAPVPPAVGGEFGAAVVDAHAIRQCDPLWDRVAGGEPLRDALDVPDSTVVFADSGGFDFATKSLDTTPERTLRTQRSIDADVYGTASVPVHGAAGSASGAGVVRANVDRALRTSARHSGESLLFASVHGHDPDAVGNAIEYLERNGEFDGFALGSLASIRTDHERVTELVLAARRATDEHLHVHGLGGLTSLRLLLYLGVDSFDAAEFLETTGRRTYLVPGFEGDDRRSLGDLAQLPCSCPVCRSTSVESLRSDRSTLVRHNLRAMATELRRFEDLVDAGGDVEGYLDARFRDDQVTAQVFDAAKRQVRAVA